MAYLSCVRAGVPGSGIGRAFYCFLLGQRIVVVHAFIKKTQETPDKELKLARKRVKELRND
jgi:phage-related protein